jgi:hypothetical protein
LISHRFSLIPNAAQLQDSPCTAAKMAILNQVMVEVFHVVEREVQRRGLDGTQSTSPFPDATSIPSPTSATASAATTMSTQTNSPGTGPTSSPLLFFVALGFGVVFTNLWSAFVAQIDL